jgi:hypothetical protein
VALGFFLDGSDRRRSGAVVVFPTVPPVLYLLIATGSGLNIGARHILPMYPFLSVLIGGAALALAHRDRRWAYVVVLLQALHAVSSARAYPNYLAYSNELWGGPANTNKYLTDSNTDWGQQLKAVKKYLDNRKVKDCWFAYLVEPSVHFSAYGIPCKPLPTADSGWTDYQIDTPQTISGTLLISGNAHGLRVGLQGAESLPGVSETETSCFHPGRCFYLRWDV